MKKLLVAATLVAALAVLAQTLTPTASNQTPTNTWTSSYGAVFDGGLSVGSAGSLGADTLSANECEGRLVANGYDNAKSPIILVLDDPSKTRMIGMGLEWVALDSNGAEVSFNQTPLTMARFWRPFASGATGLPWFYQGSFSTTGSGGPTARSLSMVSNTGAFAFYPGLWCIVPLATGVGVHQVFERINTARVSVTYPR
jgi:hypothetical protein